jgi:hypothetical protein
MGNIQIKKNGPQQSAMTTPQTALDPSRWFSRMIGAVHPPAIFVRLAAVQDRPSPSNCAAHIAVLVGQPNTTAA